MVDVTPVVASLGDALVAVGLIGVAVLLVKWGARAYKMIASAL